MRGTISKRGSGFTVLEMLMVIVAIGLLSTMVVGGLINVIPSGQETAAVNKARLVNVARISYSLTVPDSATQWAGAASDSDRVALLQDANLLNSNSSDWLSSAGGYTLSLSGALKDKTVLKDKTGTALNYSD